jgi:hypothetical protein
MDQGLFHRACQIGLAASMSDQADLNRIKPPEESPPEQPDANTKAEVKKLQRPSLTDRIEQEHHYHVRTLSQRIDYHCAENEKLRVEVLSVRTQLNGIQEERDRLGDRCTQLETASGNAGCMTLLGTVVTLGGGGMLGVAGATPDLQENARTSLCAGGIATTICGILFLIASFAVILWHNWWKRPTGHDTTQS